MNNIVFIENGIVIEVIVTDEALENKTIEQIALESTDVPINDILINVVTPKEPIESWYIEGGQIKIDQQKLIEFNRKNMPTLSPIEFDIKLVDAGLYDQVKELIQSDVKLKIAYTRAIFFSRTDAFIDQARIALNLTDEQVDEMWIN